MLSWFMKILNWFSSMLQKEVLRYLFIHLFSVVEILLWDHKYIHVCFPLNCSFFGQWPPHQPALKSFSLPTPLDSLSDITSCFLVTRDNSCLSPPVGHFSKGPFSFTKRLHFRDLPFLVHFVTLVSLLEHRSITSIAL